MATLPDKFLRIRDLLFLLPDDFSGTANDAVALYIKTHSTMNTVSVVDHGAEIVYYNEPDVANDIVLYERSSEGTYNIVDSTTICNGEYPLI